MNNSDAALDHLRVIRGLMEKATVYRAVTVPTALFGGGLAVIMSTILFFLDAKLSSTTVMSIWLGVFLVVNAFHHCLIFRTSRQEGERYLSTGFNMAMKAIVPTMFVGGVLGLALGFGPSQDLVGACLAWATFYGLALMATSGFSPRSLRVLGLGFTLTGSLLLAMHWWQGNGGELASPQSTSAIIMGMTFGVFHLVYGMCVRSMLHDSSSAS